jgi:hypothetical protein
VGKDQHHPQEQGRKPEVEPLQADQQAVNRTAQHKAATQWIAALFFVVF